MSGITLAIAEQKVADLLQVQTSGMLAMSINGRSYTFRSLKEIREELVFWQNQLTTLKRTASGGNRLGGALADLSTTR